MRNFKLVLAVLLGLALSVNYVVANESAKATEASKAKAAPGNAASAEAVVVGVTQDLLALVKEKASLLDSEPKAYYQEVRTLLIKAVDFESIAKGVMGKSYWTKATDAQKLEFVDTFTNSMVETYGKGMANFADLDIKIESSQPSKKSDTTYYVVQSVKSDTGITKVVYTMSKSEASWMLKNVVLDGVNLGKTFRSQFTQAVKDSNNDLALAISNWGKAVK